MSAVASMTLLATPGYLGDNGFPTIRAYFPGALPVVTSKDRDQDKSMGSLSDSSLSVLIQRSKAGDTEAMEEIYERYKTPLFNLASRYTYDRVAAEDLLQDIFIKVFTHLRDVRTVGTFGAWVYRIALNTCYSYLRHRRSKGRDTVSLSEVEGKREEAAYDVHEESLNKPLEMAMAQLPEKLRTVFLLHDVQGFKHEEIARVLGITAGTSKSQLFKARMRIREFLKAKKMV